MVGVGGSLSGIEEGQLRPGSTTVIVGGNGSGKSTLLRIWAGVTRPSGGIGVPDYSLVRAPDRRHPE